MFKVDNRKSQHLPNILRVAFVPYCVCQHISSSSVPYGFLLPTQFSLHFRLSAHPSSIFGFWYHKLAA